jgi:hypothetical protein
MRNFVSFLLILSASLISANARLNETLEQCIERYGNPEPSKEGEDYVFNKSVFTIKIRFLNGKAVKIGYKKNNGENLFYDEAIKIEESNVGKVKWVSIGPIKVGGGVNTYCIDDENTKYAFGSPMLTYVVKNTESEGKNWVYLEFVSIEYFNELQRQRDNRDTIHKQETQKRTEGL